MIRLLPSGIIALSLFKSPIPKPTISFENNGYPAGATMSARRQLTDADHVWNRACSREERNLRDGDLALAALLLVDGYIQNGGVSHAFDLTPKELAEGIKGYEYFGLHEMAAAIKPHRGEEEAEYNSRYYHFTRRENLIIKKFKQMFREHPERFAPLGDAAAG